MPYLTAEKRENLLDFNVTVGGRPPESAAELNYMITYCVKAFLNGRPLNYSVLNDCVGAIEGAKMEFQRRYVGPYEEKKLEQNGDVNIQ